MLNLQESFVAVNLDAKSSNEVIQELADRLHQAGNVGKNYGKATIEREAIHATGLPTRPFPIAFPHADADGVVTPALAVATLLTPITFKNMADPEEDLEVEIVIMMANKNPEGQIKTLRNLAELFGEADKLSELKQISNAKDIVDWLKRELVLEV